MAGNSQYDMSSLPQVEGLSSKQPSPTQRLDDLVYLAYRVNLKDGGLMDDSDIMNQARDLAKKVYRKNLDPLKGVDEKWLADFKTQFNLPTVKPDLEGGTLPSSPQSQPHPSSIDTNDDPKLAPTRFPRYDYEVRPAYEADENSPLYGDRNLYKHIADTAHAPTGRTIVEKHTVPARSGVAWSVAAGNVVRISTPAGPQVGDLNLWNLHNPRERFWAARTRQLHASHVRVFDRLWSCLPYLRPLVTVTADSLEGYRVDRHGGRCHDLLGTRCDPYVRRMITGQDGYEGDTFDFHCHSNLTRAVLPWGLHESDVHDVLNVFQVTGLDGQGRYFMAPCPARGLDQDDGVASAQRGDAQARSHPRDRASTATTSHSHARETWNGGEARGADFFEFFAEVDLLCALSACPGGDLSQWEWSDEEAMRATCKPLGVEVYKIQDAAVLRGWQPPKPNSYRGMHGMTIPRGEDRK